MEPTLGLSPYGLTVLEELFFLVREKPEMRDMPPAQVCLRTQPADADAQLVVPPTPGMQKAFYPPS